MAEKHSTDIESNHILGLAELRALADMLMNSHGLEQSTIGTVAARMKDVAGTLDSAFYSSFESPRNVRSDDGSQPTDADTIRRYRAVVEQARRAVKVSPRVGILDEINRLERVLAPFDDGEDWDLWNSPEGRAIEWLSAAVDALNECTGPIADKDSLEQLERRLRYALDEANYSDGAPETEQPAKADDEPIDVLENELATHVGNVQKSIDIGPGLAGAPRRELNAAVLLAEKLDEITAGIARENA